MFLYRGINNRIDMTKLTAKMQHECTGVILGVTLGTLIGIGVGIAVGIILTPTLVAAGVLIGGATSGPIGGILGGSIGCVGGLLIGQSIGRKVGKLLEKIKAAKNLSISPKNFNINSIGADYQPSKRINTGLKKYGIFSKPKNRDSEIIERVFHEEGSRSWLSRIVYKFFYSLIFNQNMFILILT